MPTFPTLASLVDFVGQQTDPTDWVTVTQEQVDRFAQATGDHQWIHQDGERARTGPFGGPVAHGFLTLALLPRLLEQAVAVPSARMGVNYGLDRVRFPAPVPVGSRLRARFTLTAAHPVEHGGLQCTWQMTLEREGATKPVCVADALVRYYG